jgi:hypothetical protein
MKSALFVDFDNVYSGLRKMEGAVADRFARQPLDWLNWLGRSVGLPEHAPNGAQRRLLVRRCYLNPVAYQRFRPFFNRAGFEIIDCPPMTSEGKTSTDIHMVLDIIELLQHETRYDEFIVFSADADFTPVLRKLRRWDRRTTVLAIGFPSAAYQASADLLIEPDLFVREALGFTDEDDAAAPASPPAPKAAAERPSAGKPADALLPEVASYIQQVVKESPRAVALTWIAQQLPGRFPTLAGGKWGGAGSFRALIDKLNLAPLAVTWDGGGHVWDPRRQTTPLREAGAAPGEGWEHDAALAGIARQIHETTGQPLLTPREYSALFKAIEADAAEHPFQLSETSKRVRDRCKTAGEAISRADVNFVLQGLVFSGHEFGKGQDTAPVLARRSAENALGLCRREQMVVDESVTGAIIRWIDGGKD